MSRSVVNSSDIEQKGLLDTGKRNNVSQDPGPLQSLGLMLDKHINLKQAKKIWGPRIHLLLRVMLVLTFIEDGFRTLMNFSGHTQQLCHVGLLGWLADMAPQGTYFLACIFALFGLIFQTGGAILLILAKYPAHVTKGLIAWSILQVFLNGQISTAEVVAETLSLIGGLLTLLAHTERDISPHVSLIGRILLPSVYVFRAESFFLDEMKHDETTSYAMYFAEMSAFLFSMILMIGMLLGSALAAVGLRSRMVALCLAILNVALAFYFHPFFLYVSFKNGGWVYEEDTMPIPDVALPDYAGPGDLSPEMVYDIHKYYFFMELSSSAALFLLAQLGPGEMAMQRDESLLPVTQGMD